MSYAPDKQTDKDRETDRQTDRRTDTNVLLTPPTEAGVGKNNIFIINSLLIAFISLTVFLVHRKSYCDHMYTVKNRNTLT